MQKIINRIVVDETHMDEITSEFNKCVTCVENIITESKNLHDILKTNYEGRALVGVNDYFNVLNNHLNVLNLCYQQLGDYTKVVKESSLEVDKLLEKIYNKGSKWGFVK